MPTTLTTSLKSTDIKTTDSTAVYQALRHNASVADAINQIASKAFDDGEMDERQIETVIALSNQVSESLDKLSIALQECQKKDDELNNNNGE